ncbi:MAG: UvsW-1 domain-containing protein [Bacilli bacterium]
MIGFKTFLKEETEQKAAAGPKASIESILAKIQSVQTEEGLGELEKYYARRSKEAEVGESDDITVRDAISGRRAEIKAAKAEAEAGEEEQV